MTLNKINKLNKVKKTKSQQKLNYKTDYVELIKLGELIREAQ